jgi:uncharacterized repeat protein (TIGR03803 family)
MTRLSLIRSVRFLGLAVLASLPAGSAHAITILHSFAAGSADGALPRGSPTLDGSTLYGPVTDGGYVGAVGRIFRMNTDGSGYQILYSFSGGLSGGSPFFTGLTLGGSTLYGTTWTGGTENMGTVFGINTDGTHFQLLHSFAGSPGDGAQPNGSVALDGSTLYGMTKLGGAYDAGTAFRVNTDGTGYQLLHSFAGGSGDGSYPYGSLTVVGGSLFGMTYQGGPANMGVIFRMNNDGSGYTVLHAFNGTDGENPFGSLTLYGSTLYGMTWGGGSAGGGVLFSIDVSGTGFQVLHNFGSSGDGARPWGSLTLDGTTLYGMTGLGGFNGLGTIFRIDVDGTGYQVLHSFAGGSGDGALPMGSLAVDGTTLYGMTYQGGANDLGTVFSFVVPEPSTLTLLAVGGGVLAMRPRRARGEPAR